jgi:hypothetical protein
MIIQSIQQMKLHTTSKLQMKMIKSSSILSTNQNNNSKNERKQTGESYKLPRVENSPNSK